LTAPQALADLNEGLVAYYPFDGNAQDASGNGNDGTVNGATLIEDRFGNVESAYSFDGNNDYISLDNQTTLANPTFDNAVSVRTGTFWYKADNIEDAQIIYEEGGGTNGLNVYIQNSKIWIGAWSENNNWNGTWFNVSTTANQWHHVAYVFDAPNASFKLYYEGNFAFEEAIPTSIYSHSGNNAIGAIRENSKLHSGDNLEKSGLYFKGSLDDIRIYNRALSEDEIQILYAGNDDCVHATYSFKKRTLAVPFVEMPVIDFLTGQPTGEMELWTGNLKQVFGTTNRFRLLSKTVAQITDGSSSECPATYAVETGTLNIPYIDVPTGIAVGNQEFENGVEVFKATMTWEPMGKSFVVQEIEQVP
jgi:hypothetical protein